MFLCSRKLNKSLLNKSLSKILSILGNKEIGLWFAHFNLEHFFVYWNKFTGFQNWSDIG